MRPEIRQFYRSLNNGDFYVEDGKVIASIEDDNFYFYTYRIGSFTLIKEGSSEPRIPLSVANVATILKKLHINERED